MVELKEISELAKFLTNEESCGDCCACVFGGVCYERLTAERLYNEGWRKQRVGEWIVSENGCVINCSVCGYRLELCYPDGTEVRSLPCCPNCGSKMKGE